MESSSTLIRLGGFCILRVEFITGLWWPNSISQESSEPQARCRQCTGPAKQAVTGLRELHHGQPQPLGRYCLISASATLLPSTVMLLYSAQQGLCLDSRSCPISRTPAHIIFSFPVPWFCSCLSSVTAPKCVCSRNSRLLSRPELWPYSFWPLLLSPTKSSLWYLNACWLPLHLNFWEGMIHYVAIS